MISIEYTKIIIPNCRGQIYKLSLLATIKSVKKKLLHESSGFCRSNSNRQDIPRKRNRLNYYVNVTPK